jgi:aerobic-type carbon monoxide dehydrogenase small subunit (CoxS/CutS family)
MSYTIQVSSEKRSFDVDRNMPLLWVLWDVLDLKGSKFGCGKGCASPASPISEAHPSVSV